MHTTEPKTGGCVELDGQLYAPEDLKVSLEDPRIKVFDPTGARAIVWDADFGDIIDPATGNPFASFAALKAYAKANFFNEASGGGSGLPGAAIFEVEAGDIGTNEQDELTITRDEFARPIAFMVIDGSARNAGYEKDGAKTILFKDGTNISAGTTISVCYA